MGDELKDTDETEAKKARQRAYLLAAIFLGVVLFAIPFISAPSNYAWTGFGPHKVPSGEVVPGKTLWDWLDLLIIPATLLVGGSILNYIQKRREENIAKKRTEEDREIAKQRTKEEQEIVEQRTQETALQTYLDQMGKLLIERKLGSTPTPAAKDVARVWTLTVLRRVNGERKGIVLRFLYESKLIQGNAPIVSLGYADLSGANLKRADLSGADLRYASLRNANLRRANLSNANLFWADLSGANLRGADLSVADLNEAKYTKETIWPDDFDPAQAGAKTV